MIKTTRRGFLVGCSAAIAAMAGARLNYAAFGDPDAEPNQNILVQVFLRGGWDALSFFAPLGGVDRGHYETARPDLKLATSGADRLLQLGNSSFGLHPAAEKLHELYGDKKLAVVQGTGLHLDTRSHFDAMAHMELGVMESTSSATGWITRHLQSATNLDGSALFPHLSAGSLSPNALRGQTDVIAMNRPSDYQLNQGHWEWRNAHKVALRNMYSSENSAVYNSGVNALNAADIIENGNVGNYDDSAYPNNSFGDNLSTIAQMIKLQLGLRVATVDLGGWDTHERQADSNPAAGHFAGQISTLSDGLHAFYSDLASYSTQTANRVTVVVMSEFGRRVRENADRGTDHGHGSCMLLLGGEVSGGKIFGTWPGLHTDQLYDNADLAVTTDYRQILSEIVVERMGNSNLDYIFPGFEGYEEMGLFTTYIPPNLTEKFYLPTVSR